MLEKGLVELYTGNGKGKTTAALGLALRAAGHGLKVRMIQFLKQPNYGEHQSLAKLAPEVQIVAFGRPGFIRPGLAQEEDIRLAREAMKAAYRALSAGVDILILDEINVALYLGLLPVEEVLSLLRYRPPHVEIVLTGRNAPPELVASADLVTEMREIKHPYHQGVSARRGIEY